MSANPAPVMDPTEYAAHHQRTTLDLIKCIYATYADIFDLAIEGDALTYTTGPTHTYPDDPTYRVTIRLSVAATLAEE